MFQQFQQLQDDIAQLRGIVEEQSHQIAQLQADQKEQYVDLDRRVAALSGGAGPTGGGANDVCRTAAQWPHKAAPTIRNAMLIRLRST